MLEEKQTGNPVFDYRASFRRRANRLQRLLILGGLALFFVCGAAFLFGWSSARLRYAAGLASLAGVLFFLLGVAWGFYWRNKVRFEFRKL